MKGFCTFLSLGRYGRFANQIFQIAGTIGIARKNGLEPVFPEWKNYDHKDRFSSTEDIDVQAYFVNPLPQITRDGIQGNWNDVSIPWGYHSINLTEGHNYNLAGHMQSAKYFEHCIDEVRHYMKMKNEFPQSKWIAIHVRRGDYDNAYHPRLGMEYYAEAINRFPEGTKFKVFSDDIHAVKREFEDWYGGHLEGKVEKDFAFVNYDEPTYDYIGSFKLMKSCAGFIIGNSSYSAAAAILSEAPNKKVVAPHNWFGESYAGINANDIYCPDWIII
jgi:hypothetical protein